MTRELTCIICPMGCHLEAQCEKLPDGNFRVSAVTGNTCPRGADYARSELSHPLRTVTGTVALAGDRSRRLPVITSGPVPRERIFDVMAQIHAASASAPVNINDIIIQNVCGLGVDIVASRTMLPYLG